ncbi:MAG: DUF2784 domain-containing protein [Endomicrobia bacterium]|nr:DUF2784 domain-containing protein [Endomicrobiia bacterium]
MTLDKLYKLAAEIVVVIHLLWILFMISGFFINILVFFVDKIRNLFLFRTLHLIGILYVSTLAVLDKYCPLTILEYKLREKFVTIPYHMDSFIVYYLEKLIYPEINPKIIVFITLFLGVFSTMSFLFKPPIFILKNKKL